MSYEVWIHNSNGFGFAYHPYKTKLLAEKGLEKYKNLVEYKGCTFVLRRKEYETKS
tara:strand:+ start:235 stop:402 length:168 start_codon:yes stop_codon:yes gene_type:complete